MANSERTYTWESLDGSHRLAIWDGPEPVDGQVVQVPHAWGDLTFIFEEGRFRQCRTPKRLRRLMLSTRVRTASP